MVTPVSGIPRRTPRTSAGHQNFTDANATRESMRNRDCMAASMLTLLALGGPRAWCCAHVACAGLSDRFIGTARHATSALPSCFVHRLRGGGRGGRRGGRRGGGRGGEAEPAGPRTRASPGHFMDCEDPVAGPEIWKSAFLCGTELEQMEEVYRIKWDFSHLDAALQDGPLSLRASIAEQALPTKVFLFGSTEPQMFPLDENTTTVVHIPVIVAVKTSVDLPSKLGLNSVQMTSEQIVDMVQFKMSWAPLEVAQNRVAGSDTAEIGASPTKRGRHLRDVGRVFALQCTQRKGRGTLKNLAEERTRSFDYCMPYIFLPHKVVSEFAHSRARMMWVHACVCIGGTAGSECNGDVDGWGCDVPRSVW